MSAQHKASGERVHREAAAVVESAALPGAHCRLRLRAPLIAASARPGQFVNVSPPLDAALLRRPLAVYRSHGGTDIELLFKVVGRGTAALAAVARGDVVDVIGPLGNGFELMGEPPETAVLVAGGFGVAPLYPLAAALRGKAKSIVLFVGTEEELPLETSDSSMHASFVDPSVRVTVTDFEALGVLARVASVRRRRGFFEGLVTDLLEEFLHRGASASAAAHVARGSTQLAKVGSMKVYACGPWLMLAKTAAIAAEHGLACDVLLEERMGCGIGACMSCAVRVFGPDGEPVYARACVEGPVFDAATVDWKAK